MSQMLAEISRIVTEDISNRVTQYDILLFITYFMMFNN